MLMLGLSLGDLTRFANAIHSDTVHFKDEQLEKWLNRVIHNTSADTASSVLGFYSPEPESLHGRRRQQLDQNVQSRRSNSAHSFIVRRRGNRLETPGLSSTPGEMAHTPPHQTPHVSESF